MVFNEIPVALSRFIETLGENYHDEDTRSEKNHPPLQPHSQETGFCAWANEFSLNLTISIAIHTYMYSC